MLWNPFQSAAGTAAARSVRMPIGHFTHFARITRARSANSARSTERVVQGENSADNCQYSAADHSLLYTERQQAKRATAESVRVCVI